MRNAEKSYIRQFALAMITYLVTIFAAVWLIDQVDNVLLRALIAIVPVLPLLFGVLAYVRYLSKIDELQQRIQLQAVSFAAGATGLLTFTYGLLENAGLPALSLTYVFPLMIALWGLATWAFGRSYS